MREIWSSFAVILFLFGAAPASAQTPATAAALAPTPDDRVLGKPDAPVTIVEYASLTCPHCRHFATEVLPKLKAKWIDTGKVRLILRDFPLDEPALRAAMVARCAPPARFYPFIDALFEQQEEWAAAKDYRAALERIAQFGGISKKQVESCLADKKIEDEVLASRLTATQKLGVDATPTFFVNGTRFDGAPTFEAFDEMLSRMAPKA
jgi:protein-disulfide isomerase